MTPKVLNCADLFCGAGGSSTGLIQAANVLGFKLNLLAVNHWQKAVDTHTRNHPWARHMCADLSSIDPDKAIPGGKLDLLIASPECTHHSNARGGKPCSDQSRASAWHVLHWAERLRIDHIMIENVREFENWGPLKRNGRPMKSKRGKTFSAFLTALESLGYVVDKRILNAADYGEATCRKRLFIQASRKGPITWPKLSHVGRWRAAREVIDWNIKGESIFDRKRPLASRTMDRIEAGLRKFGGEAFIAVLRGSHVQHSSVDEPLGTISAGGNHAALCEPFVMNVAHQGGNASRCRSVDDPLSTIPAGHRGELALCEPFIIPMEHSGRQPVRSMEIPLPTITTAKGGSFGICEPFIVGYHAGKDRDDHRVYSTGEPLPTVDTENRFGVCQPFLTKYYGSGVGARPVTEPFDTITAKDRFALCEPSGMDIRFRMLQPHELAAAMGFDGYTFTGTKTDQVRQIGNAVSVRTAQALCTNILEKFKS
jgi:DNA (cytosine-5)-methyltransferase 1